MKIILQFVKKKWEKKLPSEGLKSLRLSVQGLTKRNRREGMWEKKHQLWGSEKDAVVAMKHRFGGQFSTPFLVTISVIRSKNVKTLFNNRKTTRRVKRILFRGRVDSRFHIFYRIFINAFKMKNQGHIPGWIRFRLSKRLRAWYL